MYYFRSTTAGCCFLGYRHDSGHCTRSEFYGLLSRELGSWGLALRTASCLDNRPTKTLQCQHSDSREWKDDWRWTEIVRLNYLCDSGACWTKGPLIVCASITPPDYGHAVYSSCLYIRRSALHCVAVWWCTLPHCEENINVCQFVLNYA